MSYSDKILVLFLVPIADTLHVTFAGSQYSGSDRNIFQQESDSCGVGHLDWNPAVDPFILNGIS